MKLRKAKRIKRYENYRKLFGKSVPVTLGVGGEQVGTAQVIEVDSDAGTATLEMQVSHKVSHAIRGDMRRHTIEAGA